MQFLSMYAIEIYSFRRLLVTAPVWAMTLSSSFITFNMPELKGGSNMTGTDCAVRLVYTQISPGHIWTTLYVKVLFS
jgi:hypothetical protein